MVNCEMVSLVLVGSPEGALKRKLWSGIFHRGLLALNDDGSSGYINWSHGFRANLLIPPPQSYGSKT